MKKTYFEPKVNVASFTAVDILTESAGLDHNVGGPTTKDEEWDLG